jgi:hypothetical protein
MVMMIIVNVFVIKGESSPAKKNRLTYLLKKRQILSTSRNPRFSAIDLMSKLNQN